MGILIRKIIFTILILSISFSASASAQAPQRIASINLCTDELLMHLAEPSRIVGVTRYTADPSSTMLYEEAKPLHKLKGDFEEILAINPDLVLAGRFSRGDTLAFIRRKKIPLLLEVPQNYEGIRANIRNVAQAIGEAERGEAWIREMDEALAKIEAGPRPHKRAVYFQSGGHVPGGGTFEQAIMEEAGVENMAAGRGIRGYGFLSLEDLVMMNPDILIFSSLHRERSSVEHELLFHPVIRKGPWQNRSVVVDSRLINCGTPMSVKAVSEIAQKVQAMENSKS